jgi:hypothetical protein
VKIDASPSRAEFLRPIRAKANHLQLCHLVLTTPQGVQRSLDTPCFKCSLDTPCFKCSLGTPRFKCSLGTPRFKCSLGTPRFKCSLSTPRFKCSLSTPCFKCSHYTPRFKCSLSTPCFKCSHYTPRFKCSISIIRESILMKASMKLVNGPKIPKDLIVRCYQKRGRVGKTQSGDPHLRIPLYYLVMHHHRSI